jgi:hypothetical protein
MTGLKKAEGLIGGAGFVARDSLPVTRKQRTEAGRD